MVHVPGNGKLIMVFGSAMLTRAAVAESLDIFQAWLPNTEDILISANGTHGECAGGTLLFPLWHAVVALLLVLLTIRVCRIPKEAGKQVSLPAAQSQRSTQKSCTADQAVLWPLLASDVVDMASADFRESGFAIYEGVLSDAAIAALHRMALNANNSRPINGEAARRQRPFDSGRRIHAAILSCLDSFLAACGLAAFEPSVLVSMRGAERQRAHRDGGQGSLIASFHTGTHLWVAPGSHLELTKSPTAWANSLLRVDIPVGAVLIFDPNLVHAGGDASCPPRVHSYTISRDRSRSPAIEGTPRYDRGYSYPRRGDFGAPSGESGRAATSKSPARRRHAPVAVGARCLAKYLASSLYPGVGWYPGVVDAANADGTYAVRYEDGDYEDRIKRKFIKALSS